VLVKALALGKVGVGEAFLPGSKLRCFFHRECRTWRWCGSWWINTSEPPKPVGQELEDGSRVIRREVMMISVKNFIVSLGVMSLLVYAG